MIQIYTGKGKGKTTAALGLAFRALGHKKRVFFVQFLKGKKNCGEIKSARRFRNLNIKQVSADGWLKTGQKVAPKIVRRVHQGWQCALRAINSKNYDLVILDELNVAIYFGLIDVSLVVEALRKAPKNVEVIITGRCAHRKLIRLADLVSEIKEVKHYYKSGTGCRRGIEY